MEQQARLAAGGQADIFSGDVRSKEDILKDIINDIYHGNKKELGARLREAAENRQRDNRGESEVADAGEGDSGSREGQAERAEAGGERVEEEQPEKVRREAERRARRREEILREGTGHDDYFGLIPVSETMTAEGIETNVRRIVEGLKEREKSGTFDGFNGFAYNGNYKRNAGYQVMEYLISLDDVVPDETLRQWAATHDIETNDDVRAYGEKLYSGKVREHRAEGEAEEQSEWRKALGEGLDEVLRETKGEGYHTDLDEGQQRLLEAGNKAQTMKGKKKTASETVKLNSPEGEQANVTDISDAESGAKVLKNIDTLAKKYEEKSNQPRNILKDIAEAIGAKSKGSVSKYATIKAKNGKIVTIRLSNHNAKVRNFDNNNEPEGMSIVVAGAPNNGINNNGKAHIVEYFYRSQDLRSADGKPLVDIIRSVEQMLYSGEYKDTTGLAQRQEVNAEDLKSDEPNYFRTPEGTVYGFTVDGEIYIDPRIATPETRVHEYAHLWAQGLKEKNPRGWERLKSEMAKEADVIDYVKRLYPELFKDGVTDEGMEEVFAHYSGRRGAERLEREMKEEMAKANGVFEKAQVASVFAKIRDLLSKFWKMSRDLFAGKVRGIEKLKGEDFADMMLGDLLGHFDPWKKNKEWEAKRDREYMEAVERGDMEKAQRMVDEAARKAGYVSDADYRMHHTAPNGRDGFSKSIADPTGLYPEDLYSPNGARYYGDGNMWMDMASAAIFRRVHHDPEAMVKIYRAVPKDSKESKLRNGDWVSINRQYAKEHGERVIDGGYKIIEDEVPAKYVYTDANSLHEQGYDDGRDYAYQNTKNNRKLTDAVTYDDEGNVIPLSKRFDSRKEDIRFQKALDNGEIQEMSNRISQWLSDENIEKAKGKTREEIIKMFGNEPQPIAMVPDRYLQYIGDNITDSHVYSGMGYFIDHAVNHHPTVEAQKYLNIQEVLNNPDEVKSIKDNGNDSIVFIKQIDRYNAVVIEVEKTKDGKIIWHKSFYDQKKKPYANKGVQLYDVSSGGGVSPIIRTDESAHDGSLSVLDDAAKVRTISETTKNNLQNADNEEGGESEAAAKVRGHAIGADEMKEHFGGVVTEFSKDEEKYLGGIDDWRRQDGVEKWIPFRDVYPQPTLSDYYMDSRGTFEYVGPEREGKTRREWEAENANQWWEMRESGKYEYHESPMSPSEYLTDKESGDIYRYSDHWGNVGSCRWNIDVPYQMIQNGRLIRSSYVIGKINIGELRGIENGKYYASNDDYYIPAYKVAIENIKTFLTEVKMTDEVRKRVEDWLKQYEKGLKFMEKGGNEILDRKYMFREGEDSYTHSEEERNGMVERAEALGEKLGTAIRVVDDVESLQHSDPEVLEKMKKAKGWYDRVSGRVTIVPGNIEDVEDAVATVMHEVVGHKGMRELVGKENYDRFLDAVYGHLTDELKREIDERVGRTFIDGQLNAGGRESVPEGHYEGLRRTTKERGRRRWQRRWRGLPTRSIRT